MIDTFNYLGAFNGFYIKKDKHIFHSPQFKDLIFCQESPLFIDVSSIIEIISRYHFFADRTLVKGIYRVPWMAKLNETKERFIFADIPPHGNISMPEAEVAQCLFIRLNQEILEFLDGKNAVGLLLSGGMDSRIIASVLDYLKRTNQTKVNFVAITWGLDQTRDVIYARKIARRLGWDWLHFPINAEVLRNNIHETAKRGCEYSPVHLHAMAQIREIDGLDCIIAASYGDSVGRAEFSGRHVTSLLSFERYILNWFKLIKKRAFQAAKQELSQDINKYRKLFPRDEIYQQNEIDQQAHYMRRKLNPCMSVINEKIPLYQAFTSPNVFGFMWSLNPDLRNDNIYKRLFSFFKTDFTDIPWARTGRGYLSQTQEDDNYSSISHQYGKWIRGPLYSLIKEKALSDSIAGLNIFNMQALEKALEINRKITNQIRASKIDEISIWLASLSEFVEIYDVAKYNYENSFIDNINANIIGPLEVYGLHFVKKVLSRK